MIPLPSPEKPKPKPYVCDGWDAAQALLTPEQWKETFGQAWLVRELETAEAQRNGCNGLLGGGTKEAGDFREKQAREIFALDPVKMSNSVTAHRCAIYEALKVGKPVCVEAFDRYHAERPCSDLPADYVRDGSLYVHNSKTLN